jgi:undecaprenyl-diphosphatase
MPEPIEIENRVSREPQTPPEPEREPEEDHQADPAPDLLGRPSPEAQAAAAPAQEAVADAVRQIKTPEQAEQVAAAAVQAAGDDRERRIREREGAAADPAAVIQATAEAGSGPEQASATLVEAARQVAASEGETREALEQAVQKATNPEQQGVTGPAATEPHELLREAILKQMTPYQAVDARLFLAINHLPHTGVTNGAMTAITTTMNGGLLWLLVLAITAVLDGKRGRRALLQIIPPFSFASLIVEYPIKYYFRRRRPFVDVVQAIAIGRKPGTYSFPSGHSAAAFAGAWLLRRHYPTLTPLWYVIAVLVGFSRIFLGVHYPGDVLSGALSGTVLAELSRWIIDKGDDVEP